MALSRHVSEAFQSVQRRFWLRNSRWRFDHLPSSRRVRVDLHTDGRQLPLLLSCLHDAGYGVQLSGGPMLFRELLSLRRRFPLAARVDARELECELTLTDRSVQKSCNRTIFISYDVFTPGQTGERLPYGMHPSIYYNARHRHPFRSVWAHIPRPIRVAFYGTHDPDFYSKSYAFPGLNRSEILDCFLWDYRHQFSSLPAAGQAQLVVSIDYAGGELQPKQYLSQELYLKALQHTAFVLCLPGWCMPLSHSLIEAMYCGAIPITNAHTYMHPPLRHGIEALTFNTLAEFHAVIEEAQLMPEERIAAMRSAVARYYKEHLEPVNWWKQFVASCGSRLLVNAEELSVPLMRLS